MAAVLDHVGTTVRGNSPFFAFQFNYEFAPTDVSEMGANNAAFIDFFSIAGNESPSSFRLLVFDITNSPRSTFLSQHNLPNTAVPRTVVIPFTNFTTRGGSPGLPDVNNFYRMQFDFFFQRPRLDIEWSAKIESIRFGRMVPEPNTLLLAVMASLVAISSRWHS